MFGLDDWLASYSDGAPIWIILVVAVLLGLRHATDPDHIAAVTTLVAGKRDRAARRAGELGLAWGLGHGLMLFAFGLPILLLDEYLPERLQQLAETAIAGVIAYLALRLLFQWRRQRPHLHEHEHDGEPHSHLHGHGASADHGHGHRDRTRLSAFGIGLAHGIGGSAGVGVLLVASVEDPTLAVASLALLAIFTAVSMTILSTGFGWTLMTHRVDGAFRKMAPVLGVASLAFGIWYGTAAWGVMPYPF